LHSGPRSGEAFPLFVEHKMIWVAALGDDTKQDAGVGGELVDQDLKLIDLDIAGVALVPSTIFLHFRIRNFAPNFVAVNFNFHHGVPSPFKGGRLVAVLIKHILSQK
jgi:hypothetical protein